MQGQSITQIHLSNSNYKNQHNTRHTKTENSFPLHLSLLSLPPVHINYRKQNKTKHQKESAKKICNSFVLVLDQDIPTDIDVRLTLRTKSSG